MASRLIEPERIRALNDREPGADGRYVLYWMQQSQRAEHNPALEWAIQQANEQSVPLVVAFCIVPDYPDGSRRHFAFMLEGVGVALRAVERRGAGACVVVGDPVDRISELAADATQVVVDRGYLRHQRRWRSDLAERLDRRVTRVEGDAVVPVDVASDHLETAARTLRPKIEEHRDRFVRDLATTPLDRRHPSPPDGDVALDELDDVPKALDRLGITGEPGPVDGFQGGTPAARAALDRFLNGLAGYDEARNHYGDDDSTSRLSPYLHFGQISPVYVAHRVSEEPASGGAAGFLEELIVRRELAFNLVLHNADYDRFAGLPDWARTTLEDHADDERPAVYTATELEQGRTDDRVWNAIMDAIRDDGWVHNQLRMYWGKQILYWTNTPEYAFRTLLDLNNRSFLDGRDPSSYANVAWCFGRHDQGFQEREVIGKVRPFTDAALRRKDDLDAWLSEATG